MEKLAADLTKDAPAYFDYSFPKAIQAAATRLGGSVRILIVLDQLEELFTKDALTKECRTAFLSLIETLVRSGHFWVIATVRSDFYQEIQNEPALVRMKEGRGLLDVLPPQPDAIASLIEEPARLAGLTFEEKEGQKLSSRILRDASNHAELLPLIEFVLLQLFERVDSNNQLTHAAYDDLGGVTGALRRKAEATFTGLPMDAQSSLGQVLQALVTVGDASGAGEEPDKPVRLRAALADFPANSPARQLIDAFTTGRLFITAQTNGSAEPTVTVAHESLLRVWPRANQWHHENIDFLRTRARIGMRMTEGSPLLKGDPLLDTAKAFLLTRSGEFTPVQRIWIEAALAAAEEKERRSTRRRRFAFASLATLAAMASAAAIWASMAQRTAEERREEAETAQKRAERAEKDAKLALANEIKNFNSFQATHQRTFLAIENYFSGFPDAQVLGMLQKITTIFKNAIAEMEEEKRTARINNDLATFMEIEIMLTARKAARSDSVGIMLAITRALELSGESLQLRKEGLNLKLESTDCLSIASQFGGQLRLIDDVPKAFMPYYKGLIRQKAAVVQQYMVIQFDSDPAYEAQIVPLREKIAKRLAELEITWSE